LELVSMSELARRRNLAKSTLKDKIKKGILPDDCFVKKAGDQHAKIIYERACEVLDAVTDAAKQQEEQVKKLTNKPPQNETKPKEKKKRGRPKGSTNKNKNVSQAEADQKPENQTDIAELHEEQRKKVLVDGLTFNEELGIYLADDVEIEEVDGKKIVTAKDALLSNAQRYQKHRALTESLKAEQLQMKLDLERGELVKAPELKKQIVKIAVDTRDALRNIPDQYGPDLLACKDLVELQSLLMNSIDKALDNLKRFKV
jgi:hypothetical protein